jgi:hypothetical protein
MYELVSDDARKAAHGVEQLDANENDRMSAMSRGPTRDAVADDEVD